MNEIVVDQAAVYVAGVEKLHRELPRINLRERGSGPRQAGDFDPNAYLDALPHLKLEPGYVLDFFLLMGGSGGGPHIYARRADEAPLTEQVLEQRIRGDGKPDQYTPAIHLIPDGSPDSWFELEVFKQLAGQFYLFWHAGYNDFRFMTKQEDVMEILDRIDRVSAMTDLRKMAQKIVPQVLVATNGETSKVKYWGFSSWGGFTQRMSTFRLHPPCLQISNVVLGTIPYDCGIRF